jgi:hypothetical protein
MFIVVRLGASGGAGGVGIVGGGPEMPGCCESDWNPMLVKQLTALFVQFVTLRPVNKGLTY